MLWGGSRARCFIYNEPCDMRKSFEGLCGLIRVSLEGDPLSGHYFFFMNKSKSYVKILTWDGTGYCIWSKKLPKGRFASPGSKELLVPELMSLLESSKHESGAKHRLRFIPE